MTDLRTRIADIKYGLHEYRSGERSPLDVADLTYLVREIEKLLPVVEALRLLVADEERTTGECMASCDVADRDTAFHPDSCSLARAHGALAALDATQATLGTSPDTKGSAPNLVQVTDAPRADKARPCSNAVSFCGGPDRYGDTCATCLATWTEEAKEKA